MRILEDIKRLWMSVRSTGDTWSYFDARQAAPYVGGYDIGAAPTTSLSMKVATVYRCVDILSSGIADIPLRLMRRNRADNYFVPDEGKMNYLLGVQPSWRLNAYDFKRNLVIDMMVNDGNAYVKPVYVDGEITAMVLLSPRTVSYDEVRNVYVVNDSINGINGTFRREEILHFKNLSFDGGYKGMTTIGYAANVINVSAAADRQTKRIVDKGGQLKMLVGNDNGVKGIGSYQPKELENLATRIERDLKSDSDVISVPFDVKATTMSMTSSDLQLLENKKFGVLEICRYFGVHPDKVFAGTSSNYKASEMSQVSFLTDTLEPKLRLIETELNAKLIPQHLWQDYRYEFDRMALYTTDLNTEADYLTKMVTLGVYTVNDIRRRKGMPPVEGGDKALMSCNIQTLESMGAKQK